MSTRGGQSVDSEATFNVQLEEAPSGDGLVRKSILDPLCWRASRFGLTPFYELSFPAAAIAEVWVGPRNVDHPNLSAQHLLTRYSARNGTEHARLYFSKSAYRG
jgi:hypothetical protein